MSELKAPTCGPVGDRWFTFLKPHQGRGLFDMIPRTQIDDYFIVYAMSKGYRRYAAFHSAVNFYKFYSRMPDREVHEVILGECRQKPRFDIDLTLENCPPEFKGDLLLYGNYIRENIIRGSIEVFADHNIVIDIEKDLTVCTSHSPEIRDGSGNNCSIDLKYSCHIIFHNYYHGNHFEAREFFDLTIEKIKSWYPKIEKAVESGVLDRAIYTSLCSLRIIGSTKDGKRIKTLTTNMIYQDKVYSLTSYPQGDIKAELSAFRRTIITDVSGCNFIPIIVPLKEDNYSSVELSVGTADEAMLILSKTLGYLPRDADIYGDAGSSGESVGVTIPDDLPFTIDSVSGSLISLKRKRASYCLLCKRSHESIGQFIRVTNGGNMYLYCHRAIKQIADKKRHCYYIGSIRMPDVKDSPEYSPSDPSGSSPTPSVLSVTSTIPPTNFSTSPTCSVSASSTVRVTPSRSRTRLPSHSSTPVGSLSSVSPVGSSSISDRSKRSPPKSESPTSVGPVWKGCNFDILSQLSRE